MITVERFPDVKDDAGICDVARVSFNKRASEFTAEKNRGLIKYLVNHGHWSPLGQARFTVKTDPCSTRFAISHELLHFFTNAKLAGFKWKLDTTYVFSEGHENPLTTRVFWLNGSVWAFIENFQFLPTGIRETVHAHISIHYPWVFEVVEDRLTTEIFRPFSEAVENTVEGFPIELVCASFRIKAPVYVARQLVKHQVGLTWNEVSRRYVDTPPEFYDVEKWRARPSASIKQGSGNDLTELEQSSVRRLVNFLRREVVSLYNELVQTNIAPEQARSILTLDMMTEWVWTGGLVDFARICRERCAPDAQYETRLVANQIDALLEAEFGEKWTKLVSKDGKRVWTGQS